ncbi:phospholipase D-like domain-containing protein [Sphingomonas canadensis]|uniref:Phospholipase D n=1 Tax=Sphingomonas canadensis TaxID=1219257 RepID=A0ABW3HAA7_9SPHN|nr:phospholipase D-like domain-containing protein [Sphingomonas canadensis]MCW3836623.1 phospholipase D-like domain-containing protein [Sphingomonas canadensis]
MTIGGAVAKSIGRAAFALAALLLALPMGAAQAQFTIPGFELIHDSPAETDLPNPDLRDATTVWVEMFRAAKRSIDIEQFYVSGAPGEPLDSVIAALEDAGKRGVKIRFLMEEKGQSAADAATIERLKAIPNLEFRMLNWAKVKGSGIIHAKFFIVDGKAAFVGSHNFDWRALKHIDETGLRITQRKMVGQIAAIFAHDWGAAALQAEGKPVPALRSAVYAPTGGRAFLVASPNAFDPAGVRDSQAALVKLIGEAKREVTVQVMEYSVRAFGGGDYKVIEDALRAAAARGAKVRLLIADWAMRPDNLPLLEAFDALPNVEVRVMAIPPASTGFIPYARVSHTKVMTIDGKLAWVGTSNWQGGYLDDSRNLEVVLRSRKMAQRVRAITDQAWNSPYSKPFAEAKLIPRPKTRPD